MSVSTKHVALVLSLAVGLRLLLFAMVQPWTPEVEQQVILQHDALGYHQIANTLLENHRFAYYSTNPPDALRTPLYPLFVAGIYWLSGSTPWVVLLVQILIDTLSCFLLTLTLTRLFDHRVALCASVFYALDPFLILYSSSLMSDVLFLFFLVATFYVFSLGITAESHRGAFISYGGCSALVALATLVRPISEYIPLLFVGFLFFWYRRQPMAVIKFSVTFLFVFLLTLSPWLIRNYYTFGRLSLSTSGPYNLLVLNVTPMEVAKRNQDSKTLEGALLREADEMMIAHGLQPQDLDEFQQADYWQKLAIKYIASDPLRFGQSYLLGILHTFTNLATSAYASMLRLPVSTFDIKAYASIPDLVNAFFSKKDATSLLIAGLIIPFLVASYLAMLVGLLTSWRVYNRGYLLFSLMAALYFILITGAAGLARFKLPSIPFYLPFVGIGIQYLYDRARRGSSGACNRSVSVKRAGMPHLSNSRNTTTWRRN